MAPVTRLAAALVGMTSVALLAACTTDIPTSSTRTVTATVTESAPQSSTSQAPSDDDPTRTVAGQAGAASTDTATHGDAGCTPGAGPLAPAERDKTRIPGLGPDNFWQITDSGGEWCGALSWVTLRSGVVMGPVRPHQLLLYQNGEFLGTGIRCNIRWGQEIVSTSAEAVTVRYLYPDPTNPAQVNSQNPQGAAITTYRWNGSRIVMEQALPAVATKYNC